MHDRPVVAVDIVLLTFKAVSGDESRIEHFAARTPGTITGTYLR